MPEPTHQNWGLEVDGWEVEVCGPDGLCLGNLSFLLLWLIVALSWVLGGAWFVLGQWTKFPLLSWRIDAQGAESGPEIF